MIAPAGRSRLAVYQAVCEKRLDVAGDILRNSIPVGFRKPRRQLIDELIRRSGRLKCIPHKGTCRIQYYPTSHVAVV